MTNDRGTITPYLTSSIVTLFKPENTSQFKLIKDPKSIRINDFLINKSIPVTLYNNLLNYRVSKKPFKSDGDLLKTMANYKFDVTHSNPQDQKLIYEFQKEMKIGIKLRGRKSNRDKSLKTMPKSPAIVASGVSTTILPEKINELCDRIKLYLQ